MSFEFWKFIRTRFLWLNTRVLIIFWSVMISRWFGFQDWLDSHDYLYGFLFSQLHGFLSIYLIVISGMGIYAIWKTNKIQHRLNMERYEREHREFTERMDRQLRELQRRREAEL